MGGDHWLTVELMTSFVVNVCYRVLFERADDEDLAWSQNSVQEILSQLEHVAVLSLQGQVR